MSVFHRLSGNQGCYTISMLPGISWTSPSLSRRTDVEDERAKLNEVSTGIHPTYRVISVNNIPLFWRGGGLREVLYKDRGWLTQASTVFVFKEGGGVA